MCSDNGIDNYLTIHWIMVGKRGGGDGGWNISERLFVHRDMVEIELYGRRGVGGRAVIMYGS